LGKNKPLRFIFDTNHWVQVTEMLYNKGFLITLTGYVIP